MRSYIQIPGEDVLEPGPLRDLTAALFELYRRAGLPSSRRIRDWIGEDQDAPGAPSHTTVASLLQGRTPRPSWLNVHSLALVLLKHGGTAEEDLRHAIDQIRHVWISVAEPEQSGMFRPIASRRDLVRATASHFAQLSFDWGRGMRLEDEGYVHGSVAISCADTGPSLRYGAIFNSDFQWEVRKLQENKILRRDGHRFNGSLTMSRESFLVYGDIVETGCCSSFIGVEVHTYGAIGIYFREYTMEATSDEIVGWWIYGAWRIGLMVHALLGTSGPAHAAVMVDLVGISDLSVPGHGSLFTSEYGPFLLWSGKDEDRDSPYDRWYNWARDAAETEIASVRAELRRYSTSGGWLGRSRDDNDRTDEERNWTPWEVRERLGLGRRSLR